jgi:Glycosyl hydrolase catalytic core
MRIRTALSFISFLGAALLSLSCGGGSSAPAPAPPPIGIRLAASLIQTVQDGAPASLDVTITRPTGTSRSVTLSVASLPAGASATVESPGSGDTGSVAISAPNSTPAGTYQVTVRASDGVSSGSASLTLVVAIMARVGTMTTGRIDMFMSTSFQPASWSDDFFVRHPEATTPLEELHPQHIRLQALERDVPQLDANTWDFSYLDRIVDPIFAVADHSPQFQIALGPEFMYDAPQHLRDTTFQEFADYCARLVEYYNSGGFTDGSGIFHQPSNSWPITYWGIYNEPNINGLSPQEYVNLYNVVVPAMLSENPNIKLVAVELADFSDEPQRYLPTFVSNVTEQVDVVATHYYSSCNQQDSDQAVFNTIPGFVDHIDYIYSQLETKPALANVPVWVTENNVNADWSNGGFSVCNGTPFVLDTRGSSAFFAAWRPLVFSRLAQAGVRALHHWGFAADAQFGEVSGSSGGVYLSYWVDYWLARYFPSPPGSDILELNTTESTSVEILPTLRDDGTWVIMIANHAVNASGDNNGPGAPRTVVLDLSALGPFSTATQLTIDARTNLASGPVEQTITPADQMEIALNGYGVTFLALR